MGIFDVITGALGKIGGYMGIAIVKIPVIVQYVEDLFGDGNGETKQEVAVAMFSALLSTVEGISGKDIADDALFQESLRKMIDGVVGILNATVWYKKPEPSQ